MTTIAREKTEFLHTREGNRIFIRCHDTPPSTDDFHMELEIFPRAIRSRIDKYDIFLLESKNMERFEYAVVSITYSGSHTIEIFFDITSLAP